MSAPRFRVVSFEGYPINADSTSRHGNRHVSRNWLIVDERGHTWFSYPNHVAGGSPDERARLLALGRCADLNARAGADDAA